MKLEDHLHQLRKFDEDEVGLRPGALGLILRITNKAKRKEFPLHPDDFLTDRKGQVSAKGSDTVKKILKSYGIDRHLASESGRTSRGSIDRMQIYLELLNRIRPDLDEVERFWIGRIENYFDSKPFSFKLDPSKSLRVCFRELLEQAIQRQREVSGIKYAGALMQHLVAAKLKIISAHELVAHGFSVADIQTNRAADFTLDDSAIHVTTAPTGALIEKCEHNLAIGLRPIVITTEDGVGGARAIARQLGIEDRIDIIEIEQFLTTNVYERSEFRREGRGAFIADLLDAYNEIVLDVEKDASFRVEFEN